MPIRQECPDCQLRVFIVRAGEHGWSVSCNNGHELIPIIGDVMKLESK